MSERHNREEEEDKESAFISLYKKQFGKIRKEESDSKW